MRMCSTITDGVTTMKTKLWRLFLLGLGGFLLLDSLFILRRGIYNLGSVLPALIGLPLLFLAWAWNKNHTGFLRIAKRVLGVCYLLGCLFLLVMGVLMYKGAKEGAGRQADGLIVLGAGLRGERVSWVLSNRLDAAVDYLEEYPDCLCVVSGGQGPGEQRTEASAMEEYLIAKGIAPERILREEKSTSTQENLLYSKALLQERLGQGKQLAFVTTDFHVYRTAQTARSLGIEIFGIPAEDVWYLRLNNFLRESVGILVYSLRGWL